MRWTYDGDAGALYVYFSDRPAALQSELTPGVILDRDSAGGVVGVELLAPWSIGIAGTIMDEVGGMDDASRHFFAGLIAQPLFQRAAGLPVADGEAAAPRTGTSNPARVLELVG